MGDPSFLYDGLVNLLNKCVDNTRLVTASFACVCVCLTAYFYIRADEFFRCMSL